MAGLCYVTLVTGHKAYTGREEEEDYLPPCYLRVDDLWYFVALNRAKVDTIF
jgi:hypothetical protein